MSTTLVEVLHHHLTEHGWSFERLAAEAGLPKNTVYRWTKGEVKRVRHWQDVAKVAQALGLNRSQTNEMLASGGHPSIDVLLERTTNEEDRTLLSRWIRTATNNLPHHMTSFVGRQEELTRLSRLLASARLVTLTGPGGAGKTRLALAAAHAVLDEFEEVRFVDLAAIRDTELVVPAISQALGLRESLDEPPLRALATHLRDRKALLVLDNFEHVVEAAPLVTEILKQTRWVKALVTSRTRLDVQGEHEFSVPPLALPCPAASIEQLTLNPAVALFADRAGAVSSSFTLTSRNAVLVAQVCTHLEGLPLSIELAAARTRQVTLDSMLDRFPGRLALANGGPRDLPDRQRTLRATIAWSYDLLGRRAQRLFVCLGVFAGRFTAEAAEASADAIGLLAVEVAEGLESLVEHNLLRRTWSDADESRYLMLETIREYALERLHERGKVGAVARAASDYYLGLAERAELEGDGQATWLPRLVAEHDNFRAVLAWCREQGRTETGLRLSLTLMPLWQLKDHQREARGWLETFTADAGTVSPNLRAKGLLWQGLLLMRGTGDDVSAAHLFEKALVLFRDAGDLSGMSETLQAKGDVCRNRRELARANEQYAGSVELAQQAGNAYLTAHGYQGLALCAQEEGRFEAAQRHWELMLAWAERSGNSASVALAVNGLGEMARSREDWREAEHCYAQTLRLARELGNEFRMALALHNLGYVALAGEEPERASELFRDSLSLYEGRQYHKGVAECLAGLGRVETMEGRLERAARLCGASEAILQEMGTQLDTLDRADYERTLGTLQSRLGTRLDALLGEGKAMSIPQAVEYAGTA